MGQIAGWYVQHLRPSNLAGRETKPAQPTPSPGRTSPASWNGREVAILSRHRDPALTGQLRAFFGGVPVPIDSVPASKFYRRTAHDDNDS